MIIITSGDQVFVFDVEEFDFYTDKITDLISAHSDFSVKFDSV